MTASYERHTVLVRARTIVTCRTDAAQNGVSFDALGRIDHAALLCEGGKIRAVGQRDEIEGLVAGHSPSQVEEIDFADCVVVPGLVDAHAHPMFAGEREADFSARQRGEKPPLGMLYTVEQTRKALEDAPAFAQEVRNRLARIAAHGTTTLEIKTGYALHKPGEMELLDIAAACSREPNVPRLVPTFLGAHALPPEFTREGDYVDYLIDQCLPFAKPHGAVFADAFCEPGFFSAPQVKRYLEAARAHGLRLRVHCDEFEYAGAARMATSVGVDAVDHGNCIDESDVRAIAQTGAVLVACPATIEYLDLTRRAPVRQLLERGGTVALASDYNPGTSPCFNLQTVAFFGRKIFGLSGAEALFAVTRGAAQSLRTDAGVLRAGADADFVALRLDSPEEFGWQFGGNIAAATFRAGERVS